LRALRPIVAALALAACALLPACGEDSADPPAPAAPPAGSRHAGAPPASTTPGDGDERWRPPPRPAGGGPAYLLARVDRVLATPAGRIGPQTPLGSPRWLLVVSRAGHRGRVLVEDGAIAPVDLRSMRLRWTRVRVTVDLRAEELVVWDGDRRLGAFAVAVGAPRTPTPVGQFTVTDRVEFDAESPYGEFALGLSAHQRELPADWAGGDQVAIHGTRGETSGRVSLGCVRIGAAGLALLREIVPLGAPVTINA
jgi:hypothetical protein